MEILNSIKQYLDAFFAFKAYIMLPVIILIIALIIRMRIKDALLSTVRLAAGFAGIFISFDFFVAQIRPAVKAIVELRGLNYPVLDVGWPPLAAITWGSWIAPLSIPVIIFINFLMLSTGTTRTLDIDIWNYWHLALPGAFVLGATGSPVLGLLAVVLVTVYHLKTADWSGVYVEEGVGLKGMTVSPLSVSGLVPLGATFDKLWDRIPFLKNWNYNPEEKGTDPGLLGEPMVIGLLVGAILGIAAGYPAKEILELSVHIAAVMFLLPKSGSLIGEGMEPVSRTLKEKIQKRFDGKEHLFIALDTGMLMKHKSVVITGLILMPISLILAGIIPGNRVIPLGDLPNLISVISIIVLVHRGNVIRGVLTGIPLVAIYLFISSSLAEMITRLSGSVGMHFGDDQLITAFTDGGNPVRWWILRLFEGNFIAIILIPIVFGMLYIARREALKREKNYRLKSEKAL